MGYSPRKLQELPGCNCKRMPNKSVPCELPLPPRAPPSTPSHVHDDYKQRGVMITGMTVMGTMLISALFLGILFAIVRLYFARRNHSRVISLPMIIFGTRDDFLDADRRLHSGINTYGLQQSIIDSIPVLKYKKHEGLVDGNDQCPVCLNEFQEGDSLRLLTKCSHGFHLPCIDTWLTSHPNCPLCRALVACEATVPADQASASEPSSIDSGSRNETLVENLENHGGTIELRASDSDFHVLSDSLGVQVPMRRSVSLDLSSAMEIHRDVARVRIGEDEHHEILVTELEQIKCPKGKIVAKRDSESSSIGKLKKSSSIGRSSSNSKGPISMKRSFSSGGNFLSSKQSRSQDSILSM